MVSLAVAGYAAAQFLVEAPTAGATGFIMHEPNNIHWQDALRRALEEGWQLGDDE